MGETDARFSYQHFYKCDLLNTLAIIDLIKIVLFRIPTYSLTSTQLTHRPTRHQAGVGSLSPGREKKVQRGAGNVGMAKMFNGETDARFTYQLYYI